MATLTQDVSATDTVTPADAAGVAEIVRAAYEAAESIFPRGGATALDFANMPSAPGQTLNLTGLSKIVDYTPRDMTILVEAGVRMTDLAATLAAEKQHLPIDVPRAAEATIGGVVATNWNGPRRYGHGTIRDYVIGIHAVDGRGVAFKGGGRVVKNVAGYDFCKLLTGSLGTLGVITQLALKIKPESETSSTIVADCSDLAGAENALARLGHLEASPVAIDLLVGGAWMDESGGSPSIPRGRSGVRSRLAIRVEGTEREVDWMIERVKHELTNAGSANISRLNVDDAARLWRHQVEFPDGGIAGDDLLLVLRIAVPPSAVTSAIATLIEIDPGCLIQAHAGSGIIFARFSKASPSGLTGLLIDQLRPVALRLGGTVVVVKCNLEGLTPHLVWGGRTDAVVLLERIKRKFDPKNILNPGRFIY